MMKQRKKNQRESPSLIQQIQKVMTYSRNRKHFPCYYTIVIEPRVDVWENKKLKCMETRACRASVSNLFRVLPREQGKKREKLKRRNNILCQSVNSLYCSWWRTIMDFSIQLEKHGFQPIKAHIFKMVLFIYHINASPLR